MVRAVNGYLSAAVIPVTLTTLTLYATQLGHTEDCVSRKEFRWTEMEVVKW